MGTFISVSAVPHLLHIERINTVSKLCLGLILKLRLARRRLQTLCPYREFFMTSNKPSIIAVKWTEVDIVPKINKVCFHGRQNISSPPPPPVCLMVLFHLSDSAVQQIRQKQSCFDYMSPLRDLDLEDSKPLFLHGTPPYVDASPQFARRFSHSEDIVRTNSHSNFQPLV